MKLPYSPFEPVGTFPPVRPRPAARPVPSALDRIAAAMAARIRSTQREILNHVQGCGGAYAGWYVGIASSPRHRLFYDHNVDREYGAWIFRDCARTHEARAVEDYLLRLGMRGGSGGGDRETKAVYAYRMTRFTRE